MIFWKIQYFYWITDVDTLSSEWEARFPDQDKQMRLLLLIPSWLMVIQWRHREPELMDFIMEAAADYKDDVGDARSGWRLTFNYGLIAGE